MCCYSQCNTSEVALNPKTLSIVSHPPPPPPDVPLKEDVADLKAGPTEQGSTQGRDGAPVEVVPTSAEEVEEQERFDTAA